MFPNQGQNMQQGGGNGLNALKQQLMTLLMFKSTSAGPNDSSSSIMMMMYSFIMITLIERFMAALPHIMLFLQKQFEKKMQSTVIDKMVLLNVGGEKHEKLSSITVHIKLDKQDPLSSALLDTITNSINTTSVSFANSVFSLNEKTPVLIDDVKEIYTQLMKTENVAPSEGGSSGSSGNGTGTDQSVKQVIEVYSFKVKIDELRKYLNEITRLYNIKVQNKLGDNTFLFNSISMPSFIGMDNKPDYSKSPPQFIYTMKPFYTNRTFANVVGSESQIIRKRVEFFLKNEKWYNKKGVPYTLGLLLSGPPGSGKTSTIKSIANESNRHIFNIQFNNDMTKTQMENLFFNETVIVQNNGKTEQYTIPVNKRIFIFEDVDCQSDVVLDRVLVEQIEKNQTAREEAEEEARRKQAEKQNQAYAAMTNKLQQKNQSSDKLTLSVLLNILDGILETPGRIIIMTSNYPKKLDKALIRPGRIDLITEFTNCSSMMICQFFENFYDMVLTQEEADLIHSIPSYLWSPAEVTKILFENYQDYKKAIEVMLELYRAKQDLELKEQQQQQEEEKRQEEKRQEEKRLEEKRLEEKRQEEKRQEEKRLEEKRQHDTIVSLEPATMKDEMSVSNITANDKTTTEITVKHENTPYNKPPNFDEIKNLTQKQQNEDLNERKMTLVKSAKKAGLINEAKVMEEMVHFETKTKTSFTPSNIEPHDGSAVPTSELPEQQDTKNENPWKYTDGTTFLNKGFVPHNDSPPQNVEFPQALTRDNFGIDFDKKQTKWQQKINTSDNYASFNDSANNNYTKF